MQYTPHGYQSRARMRNSGGRYVGGRLLQLTHGSDNLIDNGRRRRGDAGTCACAHGSDTRACAPGSDTCAGAIARAGAGSEPAGSDAYRCLSSDDGECDLDHAGAAAPGKVHRGSVR